MKLMLPTYKQLLISARHDEEAFMPTPVKKETKESFLNRCIPIAREEGLKHNQAITYCVSLWKNRDKGENNER